MFVTPIFSFLYSLLFKNLDYIQPGPTFLIFAILYQYYYIVPSTVFVRLFNIKFTDKFQMVIPMIGLAFSHFPSTFINAFLGWTMGMFYHLSLLPGTSWRLPIRFVKPALSPTHVFIRPPYSDMQNASTFNPETLFAPPTGLDAERTENENQVENPISNADANDSPTRQNARATAIASSSNTAASFRNRQQISHPPLGRTSSSSVLPTGPASQLYDMLSGRSERPELGNIREEDINTVQTIMQTSRAQAIQALSQTNDVQRAVELLLEQTADY